MLTKIGLTQFKCFERLDLECSRLNLLCGLNGTGKSTVLQALLLLRQSFATGALDRERLQLSSEYMKLGIAWDVLREGAGQLGSISLASSKSDHVWQVELESGFEVDDLRVIPKESYEAFTHDEWRSIPPFGRATLYVGAERVGPRVSYPWSGTRTGEGYGASAEYAWNELENSPPFLKKNDSRRAGIETGKGGEIVNYWLQQISPGAHMEVRKSDDTEVLLSEFAFTGDDGTEHGPYRAINVGFGLSYTFPVIIALLSRPGTLCLIENPEAHLHPRGQTKLGELAARAASAGVQIFVETHSDHFMDGVRIAVRDGLIAPNDVTFNYFQREGNTATVTCPEINEDGRLSDWPEGFFDQADENLARLLAPKDLR